MSDENNPVESIRRWVNYPYTSPDAIVVQSDLATFTANHLSCLLQERDEAVLRARKLELEINHCEQKLMESYDVYSEMHLDLERLEDYNRILKEENQLLKDALRFYANLPKDWVIKSSEHLTYGDCWLLGETARIALNRLEKLDG